MIAPGRRAAKLRHDTDPPLAAPTSATRGAVRVAMVASAA
jgi:hypothetical protein